MTEENNKELTIQERAVAALGLADYEEKLTALAEKSTGLTAITNADGYKQIDASRKALKAERLDITHKGKAARDDANVFSKAVIAEEKRLIEIIQVEETRLHDLQKIHDAEKAAAKQKLIDDEIKRAEDIQARIKALRDAVQRVTYMGNPTPMAVSLIIDDIEAIEIDDTFEEFVDQAQVAKTEVLEQICEILTAAKQRETEQKKLDKERAELDAQKAEQGEREAAQRKIDKEAQDVIDAAAKKLADDQEAFQKEKDDKAAADLAEKEAREAEERAAEQEKQDDIDEAARAKKDAEELAERSEYPGDLAVIAAIANHFNIPAKVASAWFTQIGRAA